VRVCVCVCVFLWAAMLCAGAVCGSVGRVTMIIAAFLAIGGDQPQVCECPTWATITWTPPMAGYVTVQNSYQRERVARSGYRRHVLIGKGTPTRSKDRCRARPLTVKTVKYVLGQNWSRNNDFNDFKFRLVKCLIGNARKLTHKQFIAFITTNKLSNRMRNY